MKISFLIFYFVLFGFLAYPLKAFSSERPVKSDMSAEKTESQETSSLVNLDKRPTQSDRLIERAESQKKEKDLKENPNQIITNKIKKVFEDFIKVLESEPLKSDEYKKAVKFLENSLYNEASFESLSLLAQVYENKKDFKNQINVLNTLSVNYPKNPDSFFLLAKAHNNKYIQADQELLEKPHLAKEILIEQEESKKKIIENLNQTLKLNPKHLKAYNFLIDTLTIVDPETGIDKNTKASLDVIKDMWKNLKNNKHYIPLCKAYYDNQFFKQSLKTCAKSVRKNPKDPLSHLILSLSLPDKKKREEKLILTAKTFPESFFVQYKTGLYFKDKFPRMASLYLISAQKLSPDFTILNELLAKILFNNNEEAKSFKYFLNSCLLTKGKFLADFRSAKKRLNKKNQTDLIVKFQKGIKDCYQTLRKNKQRKS
ncbi:MAG: hypothetical protein OXC37_03580 [Bdellovibrionaceae bacterium]|nr:hypothetical protein [Pseudobdellovibrionaceae bacterium]